MTAPKNQLPSAPSPAGETASAKCPCGIEKRKSQWHSRFCEFHAAPIAPAAVPESTELLPCPFCGTVPRIGYDGTAYFIRCGQHGCATCPSVSMWEKEDTIAAWNTRTPAASPVAGVSEMPDADRELYLAIAAVPPEVRTKPEAMFKKYADLLFQLAKPSAEGDGWIAVTERLPEQGERVLIGRAANPNHKVDDAWYDPTEHPQFPWRDGFGSGDGPSVTHWRPLPAPPSGQGEKGSSE